MAAVTLVQRGEQLQEKLSLLERKSPADHAELTRVWNLTAPLIPLMRWGRITGLTYEARLDLIAFERLLDVLLTGVSSYAVPEDIRLGH